MSGLLEVKLQQCKCCWCNYKLNCHKTAETTYLEANKQQTRYCQTYLEVLKLEQRHGWCFEGQTTARKANGTFLAVKNKQ